MDTPRASGISDKTAWMLLASVGVLILVLLGLILAYRPLRSALALPTPTPSQTATLAPTNTSVVTSTRTPRPTITLRPTDIPSSTPTQTETATATRQLLPTLTPALPYKFNERYDLATPDAGLADYLTLLMRQLPGNLYDTPEEQTSAAYHQAFKYALFAYQEALLRYPQAEQAASWRWGLAYSLAQTGSPAAGAAYADLIRQGLQKEQVTIQELPGWLHHNEPDLMLSVQPFTTPSGSSDAYLLTIQPGDMYLWLQESASGARLTPLFETFLFDQELPTQLFYGDLTGDGNPELAVYRQPGGDTSLHDPVIFGLPDERPIALAVEETPPLNFKMGFTASLACPGCAPGQAGALTLIATAFPACPLLTQRSYQWDGSRFHSGPVGFSATPPSGNLAFCETALSHAASFWPAPANLALLKALQPLWPPPLDLKGRLYPADSQAALAFQLGIYQALSGEASAASETLQTLASQDVATWSAAAAQFLKKFRDGQGIYQACLAQPACDLRLALLQTLSMASPGNTDSALAALWRGGVSTAANGVFDFNGDGQMESWFTLRPREGQALQFWMLVNPPGRVAALLVSSVEDSKPPIYFSLAESDPPIFQLEPHQGFRLHLTDPQGEPYLESLSVQPVLSTYTRDQLAIAEQELFSGVSPKAVRDRLKAVLASGRYNCLNGRICDRFTYLLGLAYELSGQPREAIDSYIQLWWENKLSPFTAMARSKLIFHSPITPAPSFTPDLTSTEESYPYPAATESPTTYPYP